MPLLRLDPLVRGSERSHVSPWSGRCRVPVVVDAIPAVVHEPVVVVVQAVDQEEELGVAGTADWCGVLETEAGSRRADVDEARNSRRRGAVIGPTTV